MTEAVRIERCDGCGKETQTVPLKAPDGRKGQFCLECLAKLVDKMKERPPEAVPCHFCQARIWPLSAAKVLFGDAEHPVCAGCYRSAVEKARDGYAKNHPERFTCSTCGARFPPKSADMHCEQQRPRFCCPSCHTEVFYPKLNSDWRAFIILCLIIGGFVLICYIGSRL